MSEKPIETTPVALATLDVRDASAQGLALMRERVENQKKMLSIAIGLTAPGQWTVFAGTGKDGVYKESIYPTGGAADTILRRAFGLTWAERDITVEDTPDGRMATCSAWLMNGDIRVEHFTGYRFLTGFVKNEADLRKGAAENMKSIAVRDLLGLRFRSPAELKEMGLDVGKIKSRAEFQTHDKDPGTVVVPFGKNKGQSITDIDDGNLQWLADAVKKSIEDPEKAKFKRKNQELLDALREEYKSRQAKPEEKKVKGKGNKSNPVVDEKTGEVYDYGPPTLTDEEIAAMEAEAREPGSEG
jgi:hypothetical protein